MSQNLSRAIAVFGIDIGKNLMNAVRQSGRVASGAA